MDNPKRNIYFQKFATLDENEITDFVTKSIRQNNKDKKEIIRIALTFYINAINHDIVRTAIIHNDILTIGLLSKFNLNFHRMLFENEDNVLHICADANNHHLVKYFVDHECDVDLKNSDGESPLIRACFRNSIECIEQMICCGADVSDVYIDESIVDDCVDEIALYSPFSIMMSRIQNKSQKYCDTLKKIIQKKTKIHSFEIADLTHAIDCDRMDIIMECRRFGNFKKAVNFEYGPLKTIFAHALSNDKQEIAHFLLKYVDMNTEMTSGAYPIHIMANYVRRDLIEIVLEKDGDIADHLCNNDRSAIEYALLPNKMKKTEEQILDTVKILVDYNCDINNRNDYGFRPIEMAIQYYSSDFVNKIIDFGADIMGEMRRVGHHYSPISNNDVLSFSVQCGKMDTMISLLSKNVPIHTLPENDDCPNCLLCAISYSNYQIVKYLMDHDRIKPLISDEKTRKSIYKYAIKNCMNPKIIELFATNGKKIVIDECANFENFVGKHMHICKNKNNMKLVLDFLEKLCTVVIDVYRLAHIDDAKKHFSEIDAIMIDITKNVDHVYDHFIGEELADDIMTVISVIMLHNYVDDIKYIVQYIAEFVNNNRHELLQAKEKLTMLSKFIKPESFDALKETLNIIRRIRERNLRRKKKLIKHPTRSSKKKNCTKKNINKSDNDSVDSTDTVDAVDSMDTVDTADTDTVDSIELDCSNAVAQTAISSNDCGATDQMGRYKKSMADFLVRKDKCIRAMLYKLEWPVRVSHYNMLYNQLMHPNTKYIEEEKKMVMIDHVNYLEVYKTGYAVPSYWFKSYAPNIGEKNDQPHMFPFSLDRKLSKMPCIEIIGNDPTHRDELANPNMLGLDHFLYFYGQYNGVVGCFEYFINSRQTLFHRMFREYGSLQLRAKKMLDHLLHIYYQNENLESQSE